MTKSESINELALALSLAQGEMRGAIKDAENPFYKSAYANLESCWEACSKPLSKNGLAVTQTTEISPDGNVTLITTLLHKSGQWIEGHYPVKPVKNDPQGAGSALSYARRYALSAMVGIYQTDDDAEASMGRAPKSGVRPQQPSNDDGVHIGAAEYTISGASDITSKYAGKRPVDCDPAILEDMIGEISEKYAGRVIPAGAAKFIKECQPFVDDWKFNQSKES